jgi:hypothetical protein
MFWRFQLVNSKDMSRVGPLKAAKGRKVGCILNKHQTIDFTYPLDGEFAASIIPYQTGVIAQRFNWRSTLALNQGGTPGTVWDSIASGYVLPINEDAGGGRMTVSCIGWTGRLEKRLIRNLNMFWSATDDAIVIRNILQHVNGLTGNEALHEQVGGTTSYTFVNPPGDGTIIRWPSGSSPNVPTWVAWGGTQPNEGVGGATAYVVANRNFKVDRYAYAWPYIQNLINIENGCDIHLNPITRDLTAHRRYRRVKDDVIIAFNTKARNASGFTRQDDADQIVNYFLAQGEVGVTPQFVTDTASQDLIGPVEEVAQLAGINDAAVLLAYAGAEILVRKNGVVTYGVTPFTYTPQGSVPEPFVDYREGDQIRVSAKFLPRINVVSQAVRVFGIVANIDDDTGNEQIQQLQLSP